MSPSPGSYPSSGSDLGRIDGSRVDLGSLMILLGAERAHVMDQQIADQAELIRHRRDEIRLRLMTHGMSSQGADSVLDGRGALSQADAMVAERALSTQGVAVQANEAEMLQLQSLMSKRNQVIDVMSRLAEGYARSTDAIIGNLR